MDRLFIAARNAEGIAELFRAELPGHEILVEPPAPEDAPVRYLVVGRTASGVIAAVPGLELVLSLNAGIEHLLNGGEIPSDVPIVRLVDDGLALGMSEWVLAHVLSWHRNLALYREQHGRAEWVRHEERLARERTVAVLGAGALGAPVAAHLVRFGFATRVWSRTGKSVPGADTFTGIGQLNDAVRGADILVNLLPLTAETENIIDAALLAALAPGALLINGARGGHVVDADLIAALDSGQLSSAALDVFRTEPLPAEHPFWRHEKILLSPHVSAPTHLDIAVKQIADSIRLWERGETVPNIVDRRLGY